jgi:hypothetical protein
VHCRRTIPLSLAEANLRRGACPAANAAEAWTRLERETNPDLGQ